MGSALGQELVEVLDKMVRVGLKLQCQKAPAPGTKEDSGLRIPGPREQGCLGLYCASGPGAVFVSCHIELPGSCSLNGTVDRVCITEEAWILESSDLD